MQQSYREIFPEQNFAHLTRTVEQYFSRDTPLWWVEESQKSEVKSQNFLTPNSPEKVACLWVGNAVDQVKGDRHTYIFLLYVKPEHRRRGIARALMGYLENWARARGDRQIGLQVFQSNAAALDLYRKLGYQIQSYWMIKTLNTSQQC